MILAALILGLAGSLHCLGMCGPLALALPGARASRGEYVTGRIIYNAGRIATYALLGAVFGLIGKTLALAGWQRGLSIGAGFAMLIAAFSLHRLAPAFNLGFLRQAWGKLLGQRTLLSLFGIGLLNGLLPCGLVYVALAGAAATGDALHGAAFMAIFGAGTFPAMLAVSLAGRALSVPLRLKFQRVVPYAVGVLAVLLILRGMDLGIPYLSPALAIPHSCCHP